MPLRAQGLPCLDVPDGTPKTCLQARGLTKKLVYDCAHQNGGTQNMPVSNFLESATGLDAHQNGGAQDFITELLNSLFHSIME